MGDLLTVPHRRAHGMCPVNGIRDLIHLRSGRDWSNEFVWGLGQGGGFAYLRFGLADPPRQVYWGIAGPRQHEYLAGLLEADYTAIENRSFKFSILVRKVFKVFTSNGPNCGLSKTASFKCCSS